MEEQEQSKSLAEELSQNILDEYRCISCKINFAEDEDIDEHPHGLFALVYYFMDLKLDVVYSTAGLHLQGENKRPHVHYHLIVRNMPGGTFVSCNSTHRKRWLSKDDNDSWSFDNVSIRFPKKENPVWQHLAYPLKEGKLIKKKIYKFELYKNVEKFMPFLTTYAQNLYEVSLGNRARQEACTDRKKHQLNLLYNLCKEHKDKFHSYSEMVIWLDDNYIKKLELDEFPDPRNYKTNCQKICISLGKLKYSDIV